MKKEFQLEKYNELIREVLQSQGEFRMYPKGTSMLPLLVQGRDSVVLVRKPRQISVGTIAFYQRQNGEYVLHRIVRREPEGYVMCGDNHTTPEPGIRETQIIGVVDRVYRGEREVSCKSVRYRLYCFIWRSFFVRRVCWRVQRGARKLGGIFTKSNRKI